MKQPTYKPVPVEAAAKLGEVFQKHAVIVLAYDANHHLMHCTTWGLLPEAKVWAAQLGDQVMQVVTNSNQRTKYEDFRDELASPLELPEWLITSAVRYSLNRRTYVVGECCDWLIANWSRLNQATKDIVQRDVEKHIAGEYAKSPFKAGMDLEKWIQVSTLWQVKGGEG